jgi:lysophospholipase L1-like esterase
MILLLLLSCLRYVACLRVLCIGDSLTEGFISADDLPTLHPYAVRLDNLLRAAHRSELVMVEGKGIGGEWVINGMAKRLKLILMADKTLRASNKEMEPYRYIIVLGGINDILNSGVRVEHIFKSGLEEMYTDIHNHGSRLVAMTLPPYDLTRFKDRLQGDEERRKLNKLIVGFVERRRALHPLHHPLLVDLDNLIGPFNSSSPYFSRDGLHLSIKGYDKLSDDVFRVINDAQTLQGKLERNSSEL